MQLVFLSFTAKAIWLNELVKNSNGQLYGNQLIEKIEHNHLGAIYS